MTGSFAREIMGCPWRSTIAVGLTVVIANTAMTDMRAPLFVPVPIVDCWLERSGCAGCGGITRGDTYPTGPATYAGVPFLHGSDACYGFTGYYHPGPAWTMTIAMPKARAVHVLLSTWNAVSCPVGAPLDVLATDTNGNQLSFRLLYADDVRDHNLNYSCDLINGVRTVEVWSNGLGQVIDKIRLDVDVLSDLESITFFDPAGVALWPIIFGITVEFDTDCNGDGIVDYGQILDGSLADADGNGVPDCCESPADLDGDGSVGPEDLALVLGHWGPANPKSSPFDLDRNGHIDGNDLAIVLASWGACP